MKNDKIHFILTGGTIDSVFDMTTDSVVVNDHSIVLDYINSVIRPKTKMSAETLTLKDSRDISHHIRNEMVTSIQKSDASAIVITHGTYTMPETAQYLHDALSDLDKTVVLTGSMLPIKGFSESDGAYNLGYAIAAAQLLDSGVYLAMNSYIFNAQEVSKDVENGIFVSK